MIPTGEEKSRLSLGSYSRPRMTEELKELGLPIGHRRVCRLMRENGTAEQITGESLHNWLTAFETPLASMAA